MFVFTFATEIRKATPVVRFNNMFSRQLDTSELEISGENPADKNSMRELIGRIACRTTRK